MENVNDKMQSFAEIYGKYSKQKVEIEKAYAFYAFLDEETAKNNGIKQYTLVDFWTGRLMYKAMNNLFKSSMKSFFNIDAPDDLYRSKELFYEGVYFNTAKIERAICVILSKKPTGVGIQIPFDGPGNEEFANRYFTEGEIEECKMHRFDDESRFWILAKKEAYRRRDKLEGDISKIDTTNQKVYTYHTDECNDRTYYFAATDQAEFIKVDIDSILPKTT